MGLVRSFLLGMGLAALWAAGLPAFAVETTLVADAHVNSALPAVNSGAISNLNVGGGYTALLQFDLSMLPAGTTAAQVSRATLRLYCNRMDTAGLVSVQPVGASWGEYSVTFATLPSLGSAAQVVSVSQAGAYVAVDVTAMVQGWVSAPSTNNGLALTAGTAVVRFDSKENDLTGHAAVLDVALASAGPTGPAGPAGVTGPVGPAGVAGATGPTGPQGPEGPQGAAGLNYQGAYAAGVVYALHDVVTFAGSSYVSLVSGNEANTPGVATQWAVLAQGGTGGSGNGVGVAYDGAFSSAASYGLNDIVSFQGSSYISLIVANQGNTPSVSPGQWGVMALGAVGVQGLTGATGATGPQGLTGPVGPAGSQGPMGVAGPAGTPGLVYRGNYASTTNYALGDVVFFQGASYASLLNGNLGNTPNSSPSQWGVLTAQGPIGATGVQGPQGVAGPQGLTGSVGPPGAIGPQGLQGIPGQTGAQGVTGPVGPQGLTGPMGPQGPAGPVGMTFLGTYSSTVNYAEGDGVIFNGSAYVSLLANNRGNTPAVSPSQWSLFATGSPGATGAAGPQGLQGLPGAPGVAGATGAQGAQGPVGPQGPAVANFTGNYVSTTIYGLHDAVSFNGSTFVSLTAGNLGNTPNVNPAEWAVLAAQGPAGPAGAQGPAGATGAAGATGVVGPVGPQGPPASFQGTWVAATSYGAGSVVGFGGSSYVALTANVGREPDLSPTFWAVLAQAGTPGVTGAQGPAGAPGAVGVTYRGVWVAATAYHANDVVVFGGATYLAATTSLGAEPDVSPAQWAVLAQNGAVGATGAAGAAATVSVGTVMTGAAGTQANVTNSGTANAAVLNFTIPQGVAGTGGSGGSGGGGTSGIPFATVFHSVSFTVPFQSVNNANGAASESDSVLTWVPAGCTATTLNVLSHLTNTVTVTLRQGTPGNMTNTALSCSVASEGTCTVSGSVTVAAGDFVDYNVTGSSGTALGIWTALACN